jgi:PD-(D/E)XK nuclease superfamily protein
MTEYFWTANVECDQENNVRKNRMAAGMKIKNCKKRGEWAELVFAMRAIERGLSLARPWGESSGYDFTVDQGARIARVQVKSTIFKEAAEGYSCTLKNSRGPYKKNSFDFVAAYVIPEDVWFILPEKKIRGMWSVGLYPKLESAKYREYQEAWHLLSGESPRVIAQIQACAEEEFPA